MLPYLQLWLEKANLETGPSGVTYFNYHLDTLSLIDLWLNLQLAF